MSVELITEDRALADLCRSLAHADWLALDTEFMRERTYRARLCLVQIASNEVVACIDPLSIADLNPLETLLYDVNVVKVMHAARQDIEVFHDVGNSVAAPVFDTQIAAAFLGHDEQIGYGSLVSKITGVTLAKTETRTDWSRRPLTTAQLEYAADDVRYLRPIYESLRNDLENRGRLVWTIDECKRLADPLLYRTDPNDAWKRFRSGGELPATNQQVLRSLAVWREAEAQERDLPRAWIVRDEVLLEIARLLPDSQASLARVRNLDERTLHRHADSLLAAVAAGRRSPAETVWIRSEPLSARENSQVKEIMQTIRQVAKDLDIAPSLLATRREIEQVVRGTDPQSLWNVWRSEILIPIVRRLLPEHTL